MTAPRFSHPIEVRFRDLDALGHVNNAVYLTYLESARIAYWMHVTRRSGLDALDMILARVEIDYRAPAPIGEFLLLEASVEPAGERKLHGRASARREDGTLVAEAKAVLVSTAR